jgi:predicted ATPase with chaperone activity
MGGELTLDMLDLEFDTTSKFYEAPSQVKALGGVFIIDDFGRQLVQPRDLLNRWIIPLERRVDYLTIHTGKKFEIPFDELVIFSTNLSPTKLMDTALLRRVKYKLRVEPPSLADFELIFHRVCTQHGLELPDAILKYLLEDFYPRTGSGCAAFHPIFIVEHVIATCRYEGIEPRLTVELVKDALDNIFISSSQERDLATPIDDLFQTRVG